MESTWRLKITPKKSFSTVKLTRWWPGGKNWSAFPASMKSTGLKIVTPKSTLPSRQRAAQVNNYPPKKDIMTRILIALAIYLAASSINPILADDPFVSLFDGKTTNGWRGYFKEEVGKGWKVVDGALMFDGTGGGDIATVKEYGNFTLKFEWKVEEGSNSGIMYRVSLGDRAPYFSGPEYQILDDAKHRDGKNPKTSAASLYALYDPAGKKLAKVGEWNTGKIVLQGSKVEHWVNGQKVVSADMASDEWKEKVGKSKFANWKKFGKNSSGHIVLQDHGDRVWYRNIEIKVLKD